MENPIISIIIPVYNVEKYLDRCVASVINQTYQNLEIILVDDGSPDCCPDICDNWARRDSRIKVIHKSNGGPSSARNTGLDISNGSYICFIDSDDWIADEMIEVLLKSCQKYEVKLAVCGRYDVHSGKNTLEIGKLPAEDRVTDAESATAKMLLGKEFDCSACGRLYHRSLWQNIRFPTGKIYEDIAILYKVVLSADNIALVRNPLYFYFRHTQSITTSKFTEALFDYPSNTRAMLEDLKANHQDIYEYGCWAHTKALECVMDKLAKADKEIYERHIGIFKQLSKELFSHKKIWKHSKVFSRKDRQLCFIFSRWYIIRPILQFKQMLKQKFMLL